MKHPQFSHPPPSQLLPIRSTPGLKISIFCGFSPLPVRLFRLSLTAATIAFGFFLLLFIQGATTFVHFSPRTPLSSLPHCCHDCFRVLPTAFHSVCNKICAFLSPYGSFVSPSLLPRLLLDNIMYGKNGASMDEIRVAVELANAAKFIDKLPQGLDTMVGEHGTQLSGGQKQRIAIARAILKDPRILLLDEATSALDAESERIVQEALDRIMVNRTTVIVAHRLSTVRNADMIAVIHRGKMVEKGSHSQLLQDPEGAYAQLIKLQDINNDSKQSGSEDQDKKASYQRSISRGSSSIGNSSRHSISISFGMPTQLGVPTAESTEVEAPAAKEGSEKPPKVPLRRLAYLNKPEIPVLIMGAIAAIINGAVLLVFGILISSMIKTFYEPPNKMKSDSRFWALMFVVLGVVSFLAFPGRSYFFAFIVSICLTAFTISWCDFFLSDQLLNHRTWLFMAYQSFFSSQKFHKKNIYTTCILVLT